MRKSKYRKYKNGGNASGANQIGSDTLQAFSATSSGLNRVSEAINQSADIPEGYNDDQEDMIDAGVQAASSFTPTGGIITKGAMTAGDSVNKALGADTYGGAIAGDSIKYTAAGAEMGMAIGGPVGAAVGGAAGLGYGVYSGINDKNNLEQAQKEALREEIKQTRRGANRQAKKRGNMYRKNNNYSSEIYAKKGAAIDIKGGKAKRMNSNSFSLSGNSHKEKKIDNTSGIKIPSINAEAESGETLTKEDTKAFIFSDHLTDTDGKTFAKKHKKIANAIGKAEKMQKHKPNDPYVMGSIENLRKQEQKLKIKQLITQEIDDEEENEQEKGENKNEVNNQNNQPTDNKTKKQPDMSQQPAIMKKGGYRKYQDGSDKIQSKSYSFDTIDQPVMNDVPGVQSKQADFNTIDQARYSDNLDPVQSQSVSGNQSNIPWDKIANTSERILPYALQSAQYFGNKSTINDMPLQQERYPEYNPQYMPENRRDRLAIQQLQESGKAAREGVRQSSAANQVASQAALLGKEVSGINQTIAKENQRLDNIRGQNVGIANKAERINMQQEDRRFSDLQSNQWLQARQQVANRDNFMKSFMQQQRQGDLRELDMAKFQQLMASDVDNVAARNQFNSSLGDQLYYNNNKAWKDRVAKMLQSDNQSTREAGRSALQRHNLTVEDL